MPRAYDLVGDVTNPSEVGWLVPCRQHALVDVAWAAFGRLRLRTAHRLLGTEFLQVAVEGGRDQPPRRQPAARSFR